MQHDRAERNVAERRVVFFSPDVTDVSTIKRADEFIDRGFVLTVLGFRRSRYNRDYQPRWRYFELGRTADGNYLKRLVLLLFSFVVIFRARGHLRNADWLYARNLDQLLLALLSRALFRSRARLIYEILDVQPAFVRPGLRGRFLRLIERTCLDKIELLVVSSPGFVRNYYEPTLGYRGKWFLLENKLHASTLPMLAAAREGILKRPHRRGRYRWTVSYVGLIRGAATLELMERVARRLRDDVLFKFHGILTTVDPQKFAETIARNSNMVYCGEYVNPRDLGTVYSDTDFVWALDLENTDNNSRWLLPCRFYEAGILGLPCLAARDFELGRKIDALEVGWTFAAPFEEELTAFFLSVTTDAYDERRSRLLDLPAPAFIAGEDVSVLTHFMSSDSFDKDLHGVRPGERTEAMRLVAAGGTERQGMPRLTLEEGDHPASLR